jgi:rSAM-associated Gly-rich repeat protein
MAFFSRTRLFGLLFLLSLPLEGAAALAVAAAQQVAPSASTAPVTSGVGAGLTLEQRLQRIALAVEQRQGDADRPDPAADAAAGDGEFSPQDRLAYMFVNAPTVGWGNGGFRNGGFYNGGFRNGGFYNGGFRNGGFYNGGFRNGGGWHNGGFRNGGFRNAW